jgi:tetratricopeptide (TPR) repeat protein
MAAMGKQSGALAVLDEALSLVKTQSIDGTAVAQALSTKANVLIQLGRYDEANAIVHRLLANAKQREDKLGAAISLTLASMIGQRTKEWEVAYENAELSVQLFKEVHDKRGIAWSLTALATCRMLLEGARDRNFNAIAEHIREAIVINSEIGQCSLDYYAFLKQSRRWVHSRGVQPFQVLLSLIETEIKRVGATQVLDYETESQHLIAQT